MAYVRMAALYRGPTAVSKPGRCLMTTSWSCISERVGMRSVSRRKPAFCAGTSHCGRTGADTAHASRLTEAVSDTTAAGSLALSGTGRARAASRARRRCRRRRVDAADDRRGHLSRLAEDELGGAGDLVGDRDLRRVQLAAARVGGAAEVAKGARPATPSATSVVPWRQARPNESLTITPTSAPASSASRVASRAAEASGSSGSSTS